MVNKESKIESKAITATQQRIIEALLDDKDEYAKNYTKYLGSLSDSFALGFYSAVQCLEDLIAVGKIHKLSGRVEDSLNL